LVITVALLVPLVVAYLMGKPLMGIFVGITAQLITSAKIRGPYPQQAVVLLVGTLAVGAAAVIGTLAGGHWWIVIGLMALIAGIASLARGLGEHGQALGICAVLLFLLSLRAPNNWHTAGERLLMVLTGGAWASVLTLLFWPILPHLPFYLTAARPWEISSHLMQLATQTPAEKSESELDKQEALLTQSVNQVLPLLQKNGKGSAPIRREVLKIARGAYRFGASALALHHELSHLPPLESYRNLWPSILRAAQALSTAAHEVAGTIATMNEFRYAHTQINIERAATAVEVLHRRIKSANLEVHDRLVVLRLVTLLTPAVSYLRDAMRMLDRIEKKKDTTTLLASWDLRFRIRLQWQRVLMQLQPNSTLLRHTLRVMLVTALGISLYYQFNIPRGYWIVLTVMVVLQPDFGTTRQKSTERLMGTLIGAILGTILLMHPFHPFFLVLAITVCNFLFVYFQPRNYQVSVVFVTMMLVSMLEIAEPIDWHIAAYRLMATAIGGMMAVTAAYLLWPSWERMQFPVRMARAIRFNRNYLLQIGHELQDKAGFHARVIADHRKAEVENMNTLEAIKRMALEPGTTKTALQQAQTLAFHNAKLTRELTAFSAFLPGLTSTFDFPEAHELIAECGQALETMATAIEAGRPLEGLRPQLNSLCKDLEQEMKGIEAQIQTQPEHVLQAESELLNFELICSQLNTITSEIFAMAKLMNPSEDISTLAH
jgi:uncharacterized membrane protein YccC